MSTPEPTSSTKRFSRLTPGLLVGLALLGGFFLREPLLDVFARRVDFNAIGLAAVAGLTGLAVAALVVSLRARALDPTFRGVYSELTRIVAFLEVAFMAITWITIVATRAY